MTQYDDCRFEDTAHYRIVMVCLCVWWLMFVLRAFALITAGVVANESVEQGSIENQLLIISAAGLGLFHMPRAWHVLKSREGRTLLLLLLAYCGWSAVSYIWTIDSALTVRRLLAFVMLMTGCVGIGAGFYSRLSDGPMAFARHVIYASFAAVLILLPPRLQRVSLQDIVNPNFNMKDTTEIAMLSYPAGYGLLAAIVVFRWRTILRWSSLLFLFLVLVLLKGRSMLGDVMASGTILASRLTLVPGLRGVLLTVGLLLTAFFADLGTGGKFFVSFISNAYDSLGPVLPWLTVGDGLKNLTSLSGRLPLWNAIYPYIELNPILGYGFGAFWNPEHLDQILTLSGWHAVVAHNGFLDEILATGMIGLALFLAFWIYAMVISIRAAHLYDEQIGHLMFGWLLLFLLFNTLDSVMQSYFKSPTLFAVTGVFSMSQFFSEGVPLEMVIRSGEPFYLRRVSA